jgi:hypothetical protein
MGQPIVYCSKCSAQLRGSDFEAHKAFRVDDLNFCAACCPKGAVAQPAPPTPRPSASGRIPIVPHVAPAAPRESSGSSTGILVAVGVAIVLVLLVFVFSGGEERRPSPQPVAATPAKPVVPVPREPSAEESQAARDLAARREVRTDRERAEWKLQETKTPEAPQREAPVALVKPEPAPAPPPPAPAAPDRSKEEAARAAKWEAAVAPATARDYPAAIAALEKLGNAAADLPLLKSVAALHQEAVHALARTPKGQKVAIDCRDRRVEGSFVESENGLVDLRIDAAAVEVEVGEIAPSWLADHLKSRGSAVDPTAAAVFCLLEGDEAGARRLAGDKAGAIPERYWTYARKVAGAPEPARPLYQEALGLAGSFATATDAVPKYQALLRDHADSVFVRRNRATITARLQTCARDYLFVAADLKPAGSFKAARSAKGNGCWTSESDTDSPRLKDNFIEISYSVLPDAAYRCWIYAGGCCQETFEFWAQGTEMKAGKEKEPVEPGSGAAMNVKPYLPNLKKTHALHTGPKQPSHWEWVPISLPKYSKAGPQQVRVLSSQKGFSVAFAVVSSTRSGPPREVDLRELEKTRGATPPVAVPGPKPTVLFALAFDGKDGQLVGEVRDRALHGVPLFGSCFAGPERNPVFKMTPQGELRLTYFLKTPTPLTARFRILRDGKTYMFDAVVAQPVVGRPTELRLPFSDFKPPYDKTLAPWGPGEPVQMVYIFGLDPNCGLRLDALSAVEIK